MNHGWVRRQGFNTQNAVLSHQTLQIASPVKQMICELKRELHICVFKINGEGLYRMLYGMIQATQILLICLYFSEVYREHQ